MPFSINNTLPPTTVYWHWPVRAGVLKNSIHNARAMAQPHWAGMLSTLTDIDPFDLINNRLNILLLEGILEVHKILDKRSSIESDVVLVKVEDSLINSKAFKDDAAVLAKQMNKKNSTGAVFFYSSGIGTPYWFDQLMVELSHNQGINTAIKMVQQTKGIGFTSAVMEKETKLSKQAEKVGEDLFTGKMKLKKPVHYYLGSNKALNIVLHAAPSIELNNGVELGRFLKQYKDQLDYTGESRGASLLVELKKESRMGSMAKPVPKAKKPLVKKAAAKKRAIKKGGAYWPGEGQKINRYIPSVKPVKKAAKRSAAKPLKKAAKKAASGRAGRSASIETIAAITKKTKPAPSVPRYLQADINKKGSKKSVTDFLLPQTDYNLKVRIGEKDKAFISEETAIDVASIFEDVKVKQATIDLEIRCNTAKKPLYGKIILPREGNSRFANFPISTGKKLKTFIAEIYAYHKGRLLQKSILQIDIRKAGEPAVLEKAVLRTELILRKKLDTIDDRQSFSASMILAADDNPDAPPPGQVNGKPLGFNLNSAMETQMSKIRSFIEDVVTNEASSKPDLNDEANVDLLRQLASQGSLLYEVHLKKTNLLGPLQIVTNKREYVPLEFAYSFPAPDADAKICPNAKQSLKDGACKHCFTEKAERHAHICPFGFWGLSHVIERHHYDTETDTGTNDYVIRNEPGGNRSVLKVLNRTYYAESSKVDNGNEGLTKKVDKVIAGNAASPYKASNWKDWLKKMPANNPDNFILIVHMENDQRVGVDSLEIGENDLLPVTRFDEEYINAAAKGKTPFVVLIGCETANLNSYAFDAGNLLIGRGAAIVLTNFTRIRGKHAGLVVMRLVELLKENAKKEIEFGKIVLKLKQQLLAEGIMVSLTLLAHGDADWKVKT